MESSVAATARQPIVFVLDKDGKFKPYSKSFLQNQFRQGNLSEKLLVSNRSDPTSQADFAPISTCEWFFTIDEPTTAAPMQEDSSPSPPAMPSSSPSHLYNSPFRNSVGPGLMRQGSLGRLKPKFPTIGGASSRSLFQTRSPPEYKATLGPATSSPTTQDSFSLKSRLASTPPQQQSVGLSRVLDHVPLSDEDDLHVGYSLEFLLYMQNEYMVHDEIQPLGTRFANEVLQSEIDFLQNMQVAIANGRFSPIALAQAFQHHHAQALEVSTQFLDANKCAQLLVPDVNSQDQVYFEGILSKRSTNVMRDWKRRYFQIREDKLVYFKHRQHDPIVVCELALCMVRSKDLPGHGSLTFEVVSNTRRSLLLMAGSSEEKELWIAALRRGIERCLIGSSPASPTHATTTSDQKLTSSPTCFDCGINLEQHNWVSINLGVYVCIACSGMHRSLGTHISKVRSLLLDTLPKTQLEIIRRLGNEVMRKIYVEHPIGLMPDMPYVIRDKYVLKKYLDSGEEAAAAVVDQVFPEAIKMDQLDRVAWCVAHGKPPFVLPHMRCTALHVAAEFGSDVMCEFLLLNGADLSAMDADMHTPSDLAVDRGNPKAQAIFRNWAASLSMSRQPPSANEAAVQVDV